MAIDQRNLEAADIVVIVVYFVIVIIFGLVGSLKNRGSIGGYFLAGRNMHFVLVGASLFASNIGSGHFIGLGGSGAAGGIGVAAFELNAMFVLIILGWLFVPVYLASGIYTMPQYLRKRFGGQRIRIYLAVLALLLSIFTKIAADLFAGAIFIQQSLGWNIYGAMILLLCISALFTISGGLTAVIWTDFIQTVIMLIGAFYLMIVSFIEVGGFENLRWKYFRAVSDKTLEYFVHPENASAYASCGYPPANALHLIRPANDPSLPWPGVVFGAFISSIWYWCTDQVIVQRTLAATNFTHAKAGCIVAGYIKFLPMWLIIFPGMISRILFANEIACAEPQDCQDICGQTNGCTNIAYPLLVLRLMPVGARGLMMAVMLAALISSLTSVFNSSSTIFTFDIWKKIRKNCTDVETMIVGRVFVLVMVGISIAWIPIVQNFSELFAYIQSVTSFLSPPICAVYLLAVFWAGTTERGAFWGLMIGLVIGLIRFIWEDVYGAVICGEADNRHSLIKNVNYLHFGMLLFGIVFISTVIISFFDRSNRQKEKELVRLLFWNRFSKEERDDVSVAEEKGSNVAESVAQTGHLPVWRSAFNWVCGIEKQIKMTEEEKQHIADQSSLDEQPLWKSVCDVNALVLITCGVFIWGFFA